MRKDTHPSVDCPRLPGPGGAPRPHDTTPGPCTRALLIACSIALGSGTVGSSALGPIGPSRASADEPTANERELAREKFRAGLEAAREASWEEAHDAFLRSYELYPRPITLLNLAGARLQTRRLLEAAQAYRRFLIEADEGRAKSLRETAETMLDEVEERIPKVRIRALGIERHDILALDNDRLSHATVGELLPVDPGKHELTLTRPGSGTVRAEFSIEEREWRTVVLDARPEMWPADRQAILEEEVETRGGDESNTLPVFEEDSGLNDDYGEEYGDGEDGGIFTSPWFWVAAGALLLGGGLLTYLLVSGDSGNDQLYMGNLERSIGID